MQLGIYYCCVQYITSTVANGEPWSPITATVTINFCVGYIMRVCVSSKDREARTSITKKREKMNSLKVLKILDLQLILIGTFRIRAYLNFVASEEPISCGFFAWPGFADFLHKRFPDFYQ